MKSCDKDFHHPLKHSGSRSKKVNAFRVQGSNIGFDSESNISFSSLPHQQVSLKYIIMKALKIYQKIRFHFSYHTCQKMSLIHEWFFITSLAKDLFCTFYNHCAMSYFTFAILFKKFVFIQFLSLKKSFTSLGINVLQKALLTAISSHFDGRIVTTT